MFQFFETIKYCESQFFLLDYHRERLNRTRRNVFGLENQLDLSAYLRDIPKDNQTYRCRVDYGEIIDKVVFYPYKMSNHKLVGFKEASTFEYAYKYKDRTFLEKAKEVLATDDVIFLKGDLIMDASYSNLAFFKSGSWYTPENYLLNGVKRQFLLHQGVLKQREIKIQDLGSYEKVAFVNAMRDFELVYFFELINGKLKLTLER
ncbi:MAG: 4-amino-4-deoxychorismate lyase [Psychromonas sp.]|jgi:4-amino-4-deoxychorismate lyase